MAQVNFMSEVTNWGMGEGRLSEIAILEGSAWRSPMVLRRRNGPPNESSAMCG